jgi:RNA polymerase sigma factor (sigma-70 family)
MGMLSHSRHLQVDGRAVDALWDSMVGDVYKRRVRDLWGYARRLGLDLARAEEVAQEAFARLLALAPTSRPDNADAWLFRTVHNLAIDEHRRSGFRQSLALPIPEQSLEWDERLAVWDQVDRLPERQRAAIYLRYRADFGYTAVADILGISESGARANVFRALARLREWMVDQ